MKNRFFWLVATVLLVIITHIAIVLFTPRLKMPERFASLAAKGVNTYRVFTPQMLKTFTRRPLKHMLYGGCVVQPGAGRVEVRAPIPPGYWSITAYSRAGNVVYTLNDRHAGVNQLNIVFQHKQKLENGAIQAPRLRDGKLVVPLDDEQVLAVTQVYVDHPGARRRKLEVLAATSCTAYPDPLPEPAIN